MNDVNLTYQKFVRLTGFIDLGLFTALALPFVSTQLLTLLFGVGQMLGDSRPIPDINDPFVMLAINLVGIFGIYIAWLRIKKAADDCGQPIGVIKLCAAGLFGFSVIMGAPLVLLLFLVVDAVIGVRLLVARFAIIF